MFGELDVIDLFPAHFQYFDVPMYTYVNKAEPFWFGDIHFYTNYFYSIESGVFGVSREYDDDLTHICREKIGDGNYAPSSVNDMTKHL